MTIANRLNSFLNQHNVQYEVIGHRPSHNSIDSAMRAEIPANQVAKAVILESHEGRKLMAVLPANNKISLSRINSKMMGEYHLVKENEIRHMFKDCEFGAIPPVGYAYNVNVVFDDKLDELSHVYIEAGDHKSLLRLSKTDFIRLMSSAKHSRFSDEVYH